MGLIVILECLTPLALAKTPIDVHAAELVGTVEEGLQAVVFDDLAQQLAAALLDEEVGVDKAQAAALCEHDAKRRLARARHADEGDVFLAVLSHGAAHIQ